MPAVVNISQYTAANETRNGSDFLLNTSELSDSFSVNVLELVRVRFFAEFQYISIASASNSFLMQSTKDRITRQSGSFIIDDSLVAGDTFEFYKSWENRRTESPEFTATITGFEDGGKTIVYTIDSGTQVTVGSDTAVGLLFDPTLAENLHTALVYGFGVVPQSSSFNNVSLTTESVQEYLVKGMTGAGVDATITAKGSKDWQTGAFRAKISSTNTTNKTVTYLIEHSFIVNPSYVVGYLQNLQNGTSPALFDGNDPLKYVYRLDFRKGANSLSTSKIYTETEQMGNVGWFNENFQGGATDYTRTSIDYLDTINSNLVASLQASRGTTATARIAKESVPFAAGQVMTAYLQYLPLNESEYIGTSTDYVANFVYESIRVVEGAAAATGTLIASASASLDGGDILLTLDIDYDSVTANKVKDGYYLLAVALEDSALDANDSDRVTVLIDVNTYAGQGLIEGLLTFNKFNILTHSEVLGIDNGSVFANAWNEDLLLIDFAFDLELGQLAFLNQLEFKLVAFNAIEETYFELDKYVIDCKEFPVFLGSQQIEVDTTRGYKLADNDQFNFVKIETGAKVGSVQSYSGSFGQVITWQEWLFNQNADTVFYENTEPNNNLNQKSSNYSGLNNYVIKVICEASLSGIDDLGNSGEGFVREEVEGITVYDYDVSDDGLFTDANFFVLDPSDNSDLDGQLYSDQYSLFRVVWTTTDNSLGNIWAEHHIEVENAQSNNSIARISTDLPYKENTLLLPLDGESALKIYQDGAGIVTECLINFSLIDVSKKYKLSARINRDSESLFFQTIFNTGVLGALTASITNSVSGSFTFGANNVAGNSLNTTDVYFDGSNRIVTYSASSFSGLTAVDLDDVQGVGTLDLSSSSLSALLNVTAINNNFDSVLFGTWVRTALVNIDLTNSVISEERLSLIIDNLIIANGGTTTDNGVNYTGAAGVTAANRTLSVGTITIDITTTGILYEKVIALEGVGWTITTILTICNKTLVVNTGEESFIGGLLEKTRSLNGIDFISGSPLNVLLYSTEAEAITGGATGLLASGYAAVDAWLRDDANYNAWVAGMNKGIRFEAINPAITSNQSNLNYKATPTVERPCGENDLLFSYLDGRAYDLDGSFDYAEINLPSSGFFNAADSWSRLIAFKTRDTVRQYIFDYGNVGGSPGQRGLAIYILDGKLNVDVRDVNDNRTRLQSISLLSTNTAYTIIINKIASGFEASNFQVWINGSMLFMSAVEDGATGNVTDDGAGCRIGRRFNVISYFNGLLRQDEQLNRVATLQEVEKASRTGSFRGAGIAHDSGIYDLAIDYDKTDGQNPTTFADTPLYTITAFGGSTFSPFLP